MQPGPSERLVFLALFGGAALATVALARAVAGVRWRSVGRALAAPPLLAIGLVATTVVASAALMFLSPHDLRVVLAALALGTGLAVVLARTLSSAMERDLRAIGRTARIAARGDWSARTGLERDDEVGEVARALDDMVERLAHAERAQLAAEEARRRLFVSLGHDLRTPLTALRAAVEAMQDGVAADPGRYLGFMAADIGAIEGLVGDLLLIARLDSGEVRPHRERVDVAEVADEAMEAVAPVAAARSIRLTLETSGDTTVTGGPRELGRAVRNLLDNAVRHSPDHGEVRVVVSNGGPKVTVRVLDDGPGFGPVAQVDPFQAFVTGDRARRRDGSGTGLGLAIVRSVALAHGGSAWIEPGPGGRVALQLPVAA